MLAALALHMSTNSRRMTMKKALIFLVFMVFALALAAQTGLFGVGYGDSFDTCDEILYYADMEYVGEYNGVHIYYPYEESADEYVVDEIKLYFEGEDDGLTGWAIFYYPDSKDDIESFVIGQMKILHGDKFVYHKNGEFYSWDFDDKHFVEAGFTEDKSRYYVEYGTEFEE